VEILAGVVLSFRPELLLMNENPEMQGLVLAKIYGVLAFCFGLISHLLYKNYVPTKVFQHLALVITLFHFLISLQMYGAYNSDLTPHLGAFALHLLLALLFVFIYMRNLNSEDRMSSE